MSKGLPEEGVTRSAEGRASELLAQVDKWDGVIRVGDRKIALGGPLPELRTGERVVSYTASLCPYCFRLLPATVLERDNAMYLRRICPEHGEIEEVYFSNAEMYKRVSKYYREGRGPGYTYTVSSAPCPFNCGLCEFHKTPTALLNITVTNRCDLSCWYCFFFAERAGYVYEPTLEDIEKMINAVQKQPDIAVAVQLTGGEPLLREDLVDIVAKLKSLGVSHIQLNTHGIKFARLFIKSPSTGVEYVKGLRKAGVNTVYLSFDGVSPKTNPKNHWEVPYILVAFREGGITSVVFVPTVIRGVNDGELFDIIRAAAYNMDVVRGVNFQPVSLVGMMRKHDRLKYRITIPDLINLIESQSNGEISREDWFPVPASVPLAEFLKRLGSRKRAEFTVHPACGVATYTYVKHEGGSPHFVPISRFVDVDGLLEHLQKKCEQLSTKRGPWVKLLGYAAALSALNRYVYWNKVPGDVKEELKSILLNIFLRRDYSSLGRFHYKFLFIGMMHFMDEWNYDVSRVMRCAVHYALPDGRIVPFCAFNILNDIYREGPQRAFGMPLNEYLSKYGREALSSQKYIRTKDMVKEMVQGKPYKSFYAPFLKTLTDAEDRVDDQT